MGFRVVNNHPSLTPKAKPTKSKGYLGFIHELTCCVTGNPEVQAAHLSFAAPKYGHYGRGRGSKVSDRWCLPLSAEQHALQHSGNEELYWRQIGINPHILALIIHGLWSDYREDAVPFAQAVINQTRADRRQHNG